MLLSARNVGAGPTCSHGTPHASLWLMKLSMIICLALASTTLFACGGVGDSSSTEDDLRAKVGAGTYVVDGRPWSGYFLSRLTLAAGQKYEADIVSSSGETSVIAGTYSVLPARANNPDSPVLSDKPTLYLSSDTGGADPNLEFDLLPDGGIRFYHSARHYSFAMKKDPNFRPAATKAKKIACTGNRVDATIVLDQAQGKRGTLKITRKAIADRQDPQNATVAIIENARGGPDDVAYYEGQRGEQEFYFNLKRADLEPASGAVDVNLKWATGGQEFGIRANCAFVR
jgi:hypothetical protein